MDPPTKKKKDNQEQPTPASPKLENKEVFQQELYEAIGDLTKQFYKLNQLFK